MADTAVNRRKGTTAQHAASFGVLAETSYDTDLKRLVAHDGATLGGFPAAHLHLAQTFALTQTLAATENFFGSTATNDNKISFLGPAGVGSSTLDFRTNTTPDLNFIRKYSDTPFQIEAASSGGLDIVIDSNNNETGTSVRFLTNGIRGSGTQTLLFTVFDNTNATLVGDFTANKLLLPNTASALIGGIYFGGVTAVHNFGTDNFFAGVGAGNLTMAGGSNSFFGDSSGGSNTTGVENSFFGASSGSLNDVGDNNVFFGFQAGRDNLVSDNSFFGSGAGRENSTGLSNTFFGSSAGTFNFDGSSNVFIGADTGSANISGDLNTLLGAGAGNNLTTGDHNIVLGAGIDVPVATGIDQLTIGNLIFGTAVDGTGTSISTGNIGIAVITPHSVLQVGGSFALPYRAVAGTDTFSIVDYTIDCTSGTFTVNLPTAVGITGRIYVAKNSGVGTITLDPSGAELIDGSATATIVAGSAFMVQSSGTGWIIL